MNVPKAPSPSIMLYVKSPLLFLFAGLASLGAAAQESGKDLGSVLADNDNLSTFYKLIQVC